MKAYFRSGALPELIEAIRDYVQPGQDYIMDLCQKRTLNQNDYYYGVVLPMFSRITGYTKHKAHRIFSKMFINGASTTDLTTIQFEQYLNDCRLFIYHEFMETVPMPRDVSEELIFELEKVYKF